MFLRVWIIRAPFPPRFEVSLKYGLISKVKWAVGFACYSSLNKWGYLPYRSEWHWDRHSLFVEHPQQHTPKLRKHILRYFLLIQFFTALQISVAETQKYFSISNPTHSLWTVSCLVNCCNSWKNTTGLDLFRPPLSLDIGLKQWSFWILFLNYGLSVWGTDILSCWSIFFPSKLAQIACLPPKQARTFLELRK